MTRKEAERQESINQLREWLKPGDTVFTILRKVSRSGMSRVIEPVIIENGDVSHIGYHVARALDHRDDGDHGVKIGGVGMDMGFALVHELSSVLFRDGFDCLNTPEHQHQCPASDHNDSRCANCDHQTNHNKPTCPEHGLLTSDQIVRDLGVSVQCALCKRNVEFKCFWPECDCREYQRKTPPRHHDYGGYALRHRWL